jgi:S-DNA-T family DNA segregation ATPase FtsK/SpoIIIE
LSLIHEQGHESPEDDAADFPGADEGQGAEILPFPTTVAAPVKPQRGEPGEWKPIIPGHLRTREGRRKAAKWQYRRARHHTLYHGVRLPKRALLTVVWAAVGVVRIAFAQLGWWWVSEQTYLRHLTIAGGDVNKWLMLHKHVRAVRLVRAVILLLELAALAGGGVALSLVSLWLWAAVAAAAVPALAWIGRPDDKPIMTSAVVPVAVERLTGELIVRTLGVLGIAEMNKALRDDPAKAVVTIDGPMRDGPGWLWRGDLPPGVTAGQVSEKREEMASGLRRPLGCVWPETDHKRHPGALDLYVADEDMTKAEQPGWPLAKRGAVDLFQPAVFAYDPRGRAVSVVLMFASGIIGSIPRMGKTFLLRLLLLICALDVRCEIHAYDLKGTGDLAPLRPVAHRYRAGEETEDVKYLLDDLRDLQAELRRRTKVIRDIADRFPDRCPENKVTPELASDPGLRLHPIAVGIDECQKGFEHPEHGKEIEAICEDLVRRGPAVGIIILLATQRPDAKSIPTGISANAVLRWCLKVMGQVENDMVLGTSQYKSGIRATMFSFDDKGVLYFGGEGLRPRIVRGQNIDGPGAKLIVSRARLMRERAGRVTGYALGEDAGRETRSFIADVLAIFEADKNLHCETIADRLAAAFPEAYADITRDAAASQLRALGVTVKSVRESGKGPRSGCTRSSVAAAA